MAEWGKKREGRALGLAYIDYSGSQVAGIAEVSVDRASGKIKVHNFWCTIDCGVAIQPDNIIAQTESSTVYGLGMTLSERISIKDGVVEQSNFYDYSLPRMSDVPEMHIELIQTDNHPTGAGQMSTPLIAPAVSNAVFAAGWRAAAAHAVHAGAGEEGAGVGLAQVLRWPRPAGARLYLCAEPLHSIAEGQACFLHGAGTMICCRR